MDIAARRSPGNYRWMGRRGSVLGLIGSPAIILSIVLQGELAVRSWHEWLTTGRGARHAAAFLVRGRATRRVAFGALVLAALGTSGGGATAASTATPKLSDAGTIAFIRHEFRVDASRPHPALTIHFAAPYLYLTWQQEQPGQIGHAVGAPEAIRIDMRYANFDLWNLSNEDENTIIVDCAQEYLCFQTIKNNERYYHGNIDYHVYTFTGRRIVEALNHLALVYSDKREKNPFGIAPAAVTPDGSATPDPVPPTIAPR